MNRRRLLATAGTAVAAVAGCLNGTPRGATGSPDGDGDRSTPTDTPTDQPNTDARRTTRSTRRGTATGHSGGRFSGEPCPVFSSDADRTVCWHTDDPYAVPVRLQPDSELFVPSTDDSVEIVSFVLHNEASDPFSLNPGAWNVERLGPDGWTHVAPDFANQPEIELTQGQTYTWRLSTTPHPSPHAPRTKPVVVDLKSGTHAFHVAGSFGTGDKATVYDCVALFDVDRD